MLEYMRKLLNFLPEVTRNERQKAIENILRAMSNGSAGDATPEYQRVLVDTYRLTLEVLENLNIDARLTFSTKINLAEIYLQMSDITNVETIVHELHVLCKDPKTGQDDLRTGQDDLRSRAGWMLETTALELQLCALTKDKRRRQQLHQQTKLLSHATLSTEMATLEKDVSNARLTHFLLSISLQQPSAYVKFDPERTSTDPTAYTVCPVDDVCTTMHVKLIINPGAAAASVYKNTTPFHVCIQYRNATIYPSEPPRITFTTQIVHHAVDSHDNTILPQQMQHFINQLYSDYAIKNVIRQLARFFEKPLHPCEHCNKEFAQMALAHQHHYVHLANRYRKHRKLRKNTINEATNKEINKETKETEETNATEPNLFRQFQEQLYQADRDGWPISWFDPALIAALSSGTQKSIKEAVLELLQETDAAGVYTFPCFTPVTCDFLLQELDYYTASGLPAPRPNSMNKYGLILNSIGLEHAFTRLQQDVLNSISSAIFVEQGTSMDWHHTFLVQYKPGEDLGLDMHTDDSDVTFNICLGRAFTGAHLEFCGEFGTKEHRKHKSTYSHVKGTAVVHLGKQRHGAMNITSGERVNLIIWNKSLPYRSLVKSRALVSLYPKEDGKPDLVCLSKTHDRDWGMYKDEEGSSSSSMHSSGSGMKRDTSKNAHQPWCPPAGREHDGSPLVQTESE
jgi:ubiquitin-protein ligase